MSLLLFALLSTALAGPGLIQNASIDHHKMLANSTLTAESPRVLWGLSLLAYQAYHYGNYDTEFVDTSRNLLKGLDMYNIWLIRDESLRPTSEPIEWTQTSRCWWGCKEDYLLVDYYQWKNPERKFKVFVNMATTPPAYFKTDGRMSHNTGDAKLHFGSLTFSSDDGAVFFVIHPNAWGPFQHRFKTNTFTSFFKDGISKAAGSVTGWAAGALAGAAIGSIVPGLGNVAGAVIGGVAGGAASKLTDDFFGDYLRYIG
jgi:hypothetical protein